VLFLTSRSRDAPPVEDGKSAGAQHFIRGLGFAFALRTPACLEYEYPGAADGRAEAFSHRLRLGAQGRVGLQRRQRSSAPPVPSLALVRRENLLASLRSSEKPGRLDPGIALTYWLV
jgi:hypothetical protein